LVLSILGWIVGRALPILNNKNFEASVKLAVAGYAKKIVEEGKETPYGVPYRPHIWGAGWDIQDFGVKQYFLHTSFPEIVPKEYMLNALNFILGCHPGDNTASFASGVGSKSQIVAYDIIGPIIVIFREELTFLPFKYSS